MKHLLTSALLITCFWHTTLVNGHYHQPFHTDLVKRPKIGQKFHINGEIWTVADTVEGCTEEK